MLFQCDVPRVIKHFKVAITVPLGSEKKGTIFCWDKMIILMVSLELAYTKISFKNNIVLKEMEKYGRTIKPRGN